MIDVSVRIKEAYAKSTIEYDKIVVDGKEYPIADVDYEDDCYEDGNIFGTAIARTLDFTLLNTIDLEKKEIEYYHGIEVDGKPAYINLGKFIVIDVEPGDTTQINKVSCMDYMIKFNIPYVTELDLSTRKYTMLDVMKEACKKCNVELATEDFANNDFIVDSNQFEVDATFRQLVKAVAQMSGTFAKIKRDNKLYFITPRLIDSKKYTVKEIHKMKVKNLVNVKIRNITNDLKVLGVIKESTRQVHEMKVKDLNAIAVKKLTTSINEPSVVRQSDYSELTLKRNTHPINVVSLGMTNIEGENITLRDEEGIESDGENILTFNDNPFAYNQEKREQLIPAIFAKVKGFSYTAYELKGQAKQFMETGDPVWIMDLNGGIVPSFLFRFSFKSPNGLESELSAPSIIKSTVSYQNEPSDLDRLKRTEYIVNKQENTITEILSQQAEDGNRINQIVSDSESTTQSIQQLSENYQDKIAQLEATIEGLQVSVSTKGGGNLLSYAKENWDNTINTIKNTDTIQNAVSQIGYELVIGTTKQIIQVKNAIYSVGFLYKNINKLANSSVIINGEKIALEYTGDNWKEFKKTISVTANAIEVSFVTDTNETCFIADLMCNLGTQLETWQQNANETITDTVNIGKGVEVKSSTSNTYTRMDADGTRIYNSGTDEVTTKFTDKGTETNYLKTNKAEIAGALIQKVGTQIWFSSLL